MQTYIGIVRDHSASMSGLRTAAMKDYNSLIGTIKDNSLKHKDNTKLTVVKCGCGRSAEVITDFINAEVNVPELTYYETNGGSTPLYDSVGQLIEIFKKVKDKNATFLLMVITDGHENSSRKWNHVNLSKEIKELQATDRWSFTFRVPRGSKDVIMRHLGVPEGNVFEWEQSAQGMSSATIATQSALTSYYTSKAAGVNATRSFYSPDLSNVNSKQIRSKLDKITSDVEVLHVTAEMQIRAFCEKKLGKEFIKGAAFYQLVKGEKAVQNYKQIVLRNKSSQEIYSGDAARDILGLPDSGTVKLVPGDHGNYDIFIQSTSVNRKLVPGTDVIYWEGAVQ